MEAATYVIPDPNVSSLSGFLSAALGGETVRSPEAHKQLKSLLTGSGSSETGIGSILSVKILNGLVSELPKLFEMGVGFRKFGHL